MQVYIATSLRNHSVYVVNLGFSPRARAEKTEKRNKDCINHKREINQLLEVFLKETIIIFMDTCQLPQPLARLTNDVNRV